MSEGNVDRNKDAYGQLLLAYYAVRLLASQVPGE